MKITNRILIITGFRLLLAVELSNAQPGIKKLDSNIPMIGSPFPDFTFNDVENYSRKSISLGDFKGKWLILDFWSEYCGGCIASFPKMNQLAKDVRPSVEFFMVGIPYQDREYQRIRKVFNVRKKEKSLDMPILYDSIKPKEWGVWNVPRIFVVDPDGILVKELTELNKNDVFDILAGKQVYRTDPRELDRGKEVYNLDKPLLIDGNGGDAQEYLYRSIITKWSPNKQSIGDHYSPGRYEALAYPTVSLFKKAFYGREAWNRTDSKRYGYIYSEPILETKDSVVLKKGYEDSRNIYSYSLSHPSIKGIHKDELNLELMRMMQADLENYFPYNAKIERKSMPCYKLVASEEALKNLPTKGGKSIHKNLPEGMSFQNTSVSKFLDILSTNVQQNPFSCTSIIDETGLIGNIDIKVTGTYFDLVLKNLRKQGLDIILNKRVMDVLVIRDRILEKEKAPLDPEELRIWQDRVVFEEYIYPKNIFKCNIEPNWKEIIQLATSEYGRDVANRVVNKYKILFYEAKNDYAKACETHISYTLNYINRNLRGEKAGYLLLHSNNIDELTTALNWVKDGLNRLSKDRAEGLGQTYHELLKKIEKLKTTNKS